MRIFLIRHGETEGEKEVYKGSLDIPLSRKGIEEMEAVAKFLPSIDLLYTSSLKRALQGARIIGRYKDLKPLLEPDLRERNFGLWEGLSAKEIKERFPEAFEEWIIDPVSNTPPGGESTFHMSRRVFEAFERILNEGFRNGKNAKIAIVTHSGVIRIIICHILDIPLKNIFKIHQDFGAINVVDIFQDFAQIRLLNYCPASERSFTSL